MLPFYRYIILDGNKYIVAADTYSMKWERAFTSQLAANIVRMNFIDRGPGVRVINMTLILETWPTNSQPYKDGITAAWNTQLQNLENSFSLNAKVLAFQDPFGRQLVPSGGDATQNWGVFFTNLGEIFPRYNTPQKPFVLCEITLTEATQEVN